MTLDDWMTEDGIEVDWLAGQLKVTPRTVRRLRRGDNKPSWSNMITIGTLSGWRVMPNDFLGSDGPGTDGPCEGPEANPRPLALP